MVLRYLAYIVLFVFVAALVVAIVFQLPLIPPYDPVPPDPVPTPFPELLPENMTPAIKNETVYVSLDHQGRVNAQRIVNRIYGAVDEEALYIIDYGKYKSVENLKGTEEPFIKEEYLLWDMDLIQDEDIYYEGLIDRDLPVSFSITYYLDGKETAPDRLAGKSGELEIVIEASNNLEKEVEISYPSYQCLTITEQEDLKVPLLIQGSMEVDLNRFSEVESEEAMTVVVGQSKQLSFIAAPNPDSEIKITMQAENIELDGIEFIVFPEIPLITDEFELDLEEELEAVLMDVGEIGSSLLEIYHGADQILQALEQFQARAREIEKQVELIKGYLEDVSEFKEELQESLDELEEMLEELEEKAERIESKLEKLPDPGKWLEKIEDARERCESIAETRLKIKEKIDELLKTSKDIIEKAEELMEKYEEDTELKELSSLLTKQKKDLEKMADDYQLIDKDLSAITQIIPSPDDWEKEKLTEKWEEMQQKFSRTREMLKQGKELAGEFKELVTGMVEIKDELEDIEETLEQIEQIPEEIDRLVAGQRANRDAIMDLYTQGIRPLEWGIIEQINRFRHAKAVAEELEQLADDYRSHADNNRNRHSDVRFIMQSESIR